MTASLETLVVTAYLFADELAIPRPGPRGEITDAELIALAVAQASMGVPSDRQFLGLIAKVLPGWFPHRRAGVLRRIRLGHKSEALAEQAALCRSELLVRERATFMELDQFFQVGDHIVRF